jgi:hypothetical protein
MATTIQVKEETLEVLKKFRRAANAHSYDETIQALVKKATKHTTSMHGFLGKKPMKNILRGLRDEHDRF